MSETQNEYFQQALGNKPNWIKIGMRTYNQNLRAMIIVSFKAPSTFIRLIFYEYIFSRRQK